MLSGSLASIKDQSCLVVELLRCYIVRGLSATIGIRGGCIVQRTQHYINRSALHIRNFRNVLDEIEEICQERFASRYVAYISQIRTEEEARAVFQVSFEIDV